MMELLQPAQAHDVWAQHCQEAGHVPVTDGGDARFQLGPTRVLCCASGCYWSFSAHDRVYLTPQGARVLETAQR